MKALGLRYLQALFYVYWLNEAGGVDDFRQFVVNVVQSFRLDGPSADLAGGLFVFVIVVVGDWKDVLVVWVLQRPRAVAWILKINKKLISVVNIEKFGNANFDVNKNPNQIWKIYFARERFSTANRLCFPRTQERVCLRMQNLRRLCINKFVISIIFTLEQPFGHVGRCCCQRRKVDSFQRERWVFWIVFDDFEVTGNCICIVLTKRERESLLFFMIYVQHWRHISWNTHPASVAHWLTVTNNFQKKRH